MKTPVPPPEQFDGSAPQKRRPAGRNVDVGPPQAPAAPVAMSYQYEPSGRRKRPRCSSCSHVASSSAASARPLKEIWRPGAAFMFGVLSFEARLSEARLSHAAEAAARTIAAR